MDRGLLLGACLFLLSVTTSRSYLLVRMRQPVVSAAIDRKRLLATSKASEELNSAKSTRPAPARQASSIVDSSKYRSAAIQLAFPRSFRMLIENDEIIAKVVKGRSICPSSGWN